MATITESRRRIKSYKVLGADDDYSEQQQELHPPEAAPAELCRTVATCNQEAYPADVWAAASLCSDQGAAVLQAYEDVRALRSSYREQLSSLTMSQGSPMPATMHPLLQSGKQLWVPSKLTLPPLSKAHTTTAAGALKDASYNLAGQGLLSSGAQKLFTGKTTFTQAVRDTKEQRKLNLFGDQQVVWSQVEEALASHTQRPLDDLAMHRGAEHRHKQEMVEALQRAKPLQDRPGGPDTWNMSLRNCWERVVPLGSLFSGLAVIIRELPPSAERGARRPHEKEAQRKQHDRLMQVGRPLEPPAPPQIHRPSSRSVFDNSALLGRSLTRRGRDWATGEVLRARLDQYAEAINRQFPYKPHMPSLLVTGQSLAVLLESSLRGEVTLEDIMSHLETANPEAYQELQRVQQQLRDAEERQAEQQAAELSAAEQLEASQRTGLAACNQGIHLEVSHQSVLLNCVERQQASCEVSLSNNGTVAMRYVWRRTPAAPHPLIHAQQAAALANTSAGAGAQQPPPPFHILECQGVVLPGDTATATIIFKPQTAGIFSEQWVLDTVPAMPSDTTPLIVEVRGAATRPTTGAPTRATLEQELLHDEKMAKVHAAVERILRSAGPTAPAPKPESEQVRLAAETWDAANGAAWPPLYWPGEKVEQQFRNVYTEARAALLAAVKPLVPVEPAGKKPAAAKGKGPAIPEDDISLITWPELWSCSVADTDALIAELEAAETAKEVAAAAATPPVVAPTPVAVTLRERQAALLQLQEVRVPADGRVLLRHAARAGMSRTLDLVDGKLASIQADYTQRVAEAAEAAEAAATNGGPPPPAAPTQQWLTDKTKAGAKAQVKTLVGSWWDEISREKAAVAEWIEAALLQLDHAHGKTPTAPATEASTLSSTGASRQAASVVGGEAAGEVRGKEEEYWWARFVLLREWVRLGLPPRGDVQ